MKALHHHQRIWHAIMLAPWTVAWICCLLDQSVRKSRPAKQYPRTDNQADAATDLSKPTADDEDDHFDLENVRPAAHRDLFDIVATEAPQVTRMLERCFLADAMFRRQFAAQATIDKYTRNGQKPLDVKFESNEDGRNITTHALKTSLEAYWRDNAKLATQKAVRDGFRKLLELLSREDFEKQLKWRSPKAHAECILAKKWLNLEDRAGKYPVVGVSRAACGTCTVLFKALLEEDFGDNRPELSDLIAATRNVFWACVMPEKMSDSMKHKVASSLQTQVESLLASKEVQEKLEQRVKDSSIRTRLRESVGTHTSRDDSPASLGESSLSEKKTTDESLRESGDETDEDGPENHTTGKRGNPSQQPDVM